MKKGFTLAEVLITLGVIGVVAAITIPNLVKNYQKKAWTTQLQKSYSMLEQSFQKMLADDGVSKLSDTQVWASKGTISCTFFGGYGSVSFLDDRCKDFLNNLKNYIKIIGVEKYGEDVYDLAKSAKTSFASPNSTNKDAISFILSDGTMFIFYTNNYPSSVDTETCNTIKSLGGNMCSRAGYLYIDVNGRKGPNTFGRDIFYFEISDDGKLYPNTGKDHAIYSDHRTALSSNGVYWRNNFSYCGAPDSDALQEEGVSNGSGGTYTRYVSGVGCAARIMENGWKMDY
ncbi:type II secretion system protein [bacterium]|nr:type II secretion system protein [bacterium]